jgi:anti-anti-sigma regulatory factor
LKGVGIGGWIGTVKFEDFGGNEIGENAIAFIGGFTNMECEVVGIELTDELGKTGSRRSNVIDLSGVHSMGEMVTE